MVSHQKSCVQSSLQNQKVQSSGENMLHQIGGGGGNNTVVISDGVQINNKRPYFKVVLNSEEIKSLIDAKDEEIKIQEAAVKQAVQNKTQLSAQVATIDAKKPRLSLSGGNEGSHSPVVIVSEATTTTLNVNPTVSGMEDDDYDDDDIAEVDIEDSSMLKKGSGHEQQEGSITMGGIKPVVRKRAPIFPFEASDHYVPDNNSNNVINKLAINPPPSQAENRQGFCLRQFKGIQKDLAIYIEEMS